MGIVSRDGGIEPETVDKDDQALHDVVLLVQAIEIMRNAGLAIRPGLFELIRIA